ncbi:MAG: hypothetical protein ACWGQW_00990 [bacterium]
MSDLDIIAADLKEVKQDVKSVMRNGCLVGKLHEQRMNAMEKTQEEIRTFLKSVARYTLFTAIGIMAFLLKSFVVPILEKIGHMIAGG